ncbi:CTAG/Pcc1 family protein [Kipferlia bialata]|uniref:CTAG/Pcc1 family protein n=1 Tax=Kipferlia bialata TaxID=797122 RepID=A0A9K3CXR8_9EUKA|nr:CTAG/Pcc1 family protein [Kipferlia bialata]|eukprot:g5950.t1
MSTEVAEVELPYVGLLQIPTASERHARVMCDSMEADNQLSNETTRRMWNEGSTVHIEIRTTTLRLLRIVHSSVCNSVSVVEEALKAFGDEPVTESN